MKTFKESAESFNCINVAAILLAVCVRLSLFISAKTRCCFSRLSFNNSAELAYASRLRPNLSTKCPSTPFNEFRLEAILFDNNGINSLLKKFMYSSLPSLDLATADLYDIALLYTVKPNPSKLAHMAAIIPYKRCCNPLKLSVSPKIWLKSTPISPVIIPTNVPAKPK